MTWVLAILRINFVDTSIVVFTVSSSVVGVSRGVSSGVSSSGSLLTIITLSIRFGFSHNVSSVVSTHVWGVTCFTWSWTVSVSASDESGGSSTSCAGEMSDTFPDEGGEMAGYTTIVFVATWERTTFVDFRVPSIDSSFSSGLVTWLVEVLASWSTLGSWESITIRMSHCSSMTECLLDISVHCFVPSQRSSSVHASTDVGLSEHIVS